jgi:hypothetical protein
MWMRSRRRNQGRNWPPQENHPSGACRIESTLQITQSVALPWIVASTVLPQGASMVRRATGIGEYIIFHPSVREKTVFYHINRLWDIFPPLFWDFTDHYGKKLKYYSYRIIYPGKPFCNHSNIDFLRKKQSVSWQPVRVP